MNVLCAQIQWLYEDDTGQYKEYSPQAIAKIEQAYQLKQSCRLDIGTGNIYEIDTVQKMQTNVGNGRKRHVWRRTASSGVSLVRAVFVDCQKILVYVQKLKSFISTTEWCGV